MDSPGKPSGFGTFESRRKSDENIVRVNKPSPPMHLDSQSDDAKSSRNVLDKTNEDNNYYGNDGDRAGREVITSTDFGVQDVFKIVSYRIYIFYNKYQK